MKKLIFAAALAVALIVTCAAPAQALVEPSEPPKVYCDRNTGEIISELAWSTVQDVGLQYLATGEFDYKAWWKLNSSDVTGELLSVVDPRLQAKVAELQIKAEAGDLTLEQYIKENYRAELWALIEKQGGSKWLLREIAEFSPFLSEWLEAWGKEALAYGVDQGLIAHPSLEAVAAIWPPQLTLTQAETLALLAAKHYIAIRREHRSNEAGLEVE